MENNSEGSETADGDQSTRVSAMLSSPSAGSMRLAGSYAQRGSPGVRRAVSKPIQIIRSTSVPTQLQERSQLSVTQTGAGGSGGNTRRHFHGGSEKSLQLEHLHGGTAGGYGGMVQSLPIPPAPMLAGSLPPSRFDDVPPLSLGPQANIEAFSPDCGSLSASLKANRLVEYATSCPATLGGNFGRPPGSQLESSMSILHEKVSSEEDNDDASQGPKSRTALSILESLTEQAPSSPDGTSGPDGSVESLADRSERLGIQDPVFEMEGLDEVGEELEALSLSEVGTSTNGLTKLI